MSPYSLLFSNSRATWPRLPKSPKPRLNTTMNDGAKRNCVSRSLCQCPGILLEGTDGPHSCDKWCELFADMETVRVCTGYDVDLRKECRKTVCPQCAIRCECGYAACYYCHNLEPHLKSDGTYCTKFLKARFPEWGKMPCGTIQSQSPTTGAKAQST